MKPPLGGGALVCAAYLMRAEFSRATERGATSVWWAVVRPLFIVGLSALLPLALVVVWFWLRGALPDLHWTLFVFTPEYTKLGWGRTALPKRSTRRSKTR